MDAALRALNRFGLGARRGEAKSIGDPRGWLRSQLKGVPTLEPPSVAGPEALSEAVHSFRGAAQGDTLQRRAARRQLVEIASAEARAALIERLTSERPYVDRLVAFWSNHLCISAGAKALVAPFAGSYEREVIRSHVLGRFEDMVLASAKHPAMLVYLDNFQSIGPDSLGGQRGRRPRGLNENYARELMELHTLGVDGGYTQADVQELARVLTGWTVSGLVRGGAGNGRRGRYGRRLFPQADSDHEIGFVFQPLLHEPGTRTVLGKKYADDGVQQGERVIRDLSRHPSTATFVATKLVRHFVADEPPAPAVERIAGVFRESGGDLAAIARALIDLPESWDPGMKKFRSPQDWYVAALRAFEVRTLGDPAVSVLRQLRQPLWAPQAPKGFGDSMQEWADPDSLMNRAELARTIARRLGSAGDPRVVLDVIDLAAGDPLRTLVSDSSIAATDRLALGIAGPAFQWR
jgi:uncharacterized protein (DUF1800 family)